MFYLTKAWLSDRINIWLTAGSELPEVSGDFVLVSFVSMSHGLHAELLLKP